MTEQEFQDTLKDLVEYASEDGMEVDYIRTFEESSLCTSDSGIVVTMLDGSEFQITVVKSRRGKNEGK